MRKLSYFLINFLFLTSIAANESVELPRLDVKEKVLKNGLKVLVVEKPDSGRVACRLFYRVGSIDEKLGQTGLAHFFEHMMFKGTNQIGVKPGKQGQDRDYRRQLDEVGTAIWAEEDQPIPDAAKLKELKSRLGKIYDQQRNDSLIKDEIWDIYRQAGGTGMNAFTSNEATVYMIELPSESLELFYWVESDRMHNLELREFYSEREVVRNERRLRFEANPLNKARAEMNRVFYGGSPYSWPVIGWTEDIDRVTREEAREFYNDHYWPGNATLILVGGVKAEEAFALAEKYFGPSDKKPSVMNHRRQNFQPIQGRLNYEVSVEADNSVTLKYAAVDGTNPDYIAGDMLAETLNGKEGLLYKKLVKEMKLCRQVSCFNNSQIIAGSFTFSAVPLQGVSHAQVLSALEDLIEGLSEEQLSADRLEAVKLSNRVGLYRQLQRNGQLAVMLGFADMYGGWHKIIQELVRAQEVTVTDLVKYAKKTFSKERVFIGFVKDSRDLNSQESKRKKGI